MSRIYEVSDDDHQPLTWVQGRPVFATHLIVGVLVLSLLATSITLAAGGGGRLAALIFDSPAVLAGQVWRVVTYGFVNQPSLSFVINLVLLTWFGREVEKHLGRKSFLRLYLLVYLVPPVLLTTLGLWLPVRLSGHTGALAIFVAFATLYPSVSLFFNVLASWAAGILVGIFTLVALAYRDWGSLITLWSSSACAYLFVRHAQGVLTIPQPNFLPKAKPESRRSPASVSARAGGTSRSSIGSSVSAAPTSSSRDDMAEVDALLDKINTCGIESLTPQEHERLAAAQARLARRYEHRA